MVTHTHLLPLQAGKLLVSLLDQTSHGVRVKRLVLKHAYERPNLCLNSLPIVLKHRATTLVVKVRIYRHRLCRIQALEIRDAAKTRSYEGRLDVDKKADDTHTHERRHRRQAHQVGCLCR